MTVGVTQFEVTVAINLAKILQVMIPVQKSPSAFWRLESPFRRLGLQPPDVQGEISAHKEELKITEIEEQPTEAEVNEEKSDPKPTREELPLDMTFCEQKEPQLDDLGLPTVERLDLGKIITD